MKKKYISKEKQVEILVGRWSDNKTGERRRKTDG
jgi:hypothetical protein